MTIPNIEISTPTLYKLDSKGVTRVWRAWTTLNDDGSAVENNESGIEGGTLSGIPVTVLSGKNIGKSNETTPLQQANRRILSKLDKKLKEGYVENIAEFTQQGVMAAHTWAVSKHRMSQIALHQPKLDGIRCKINKDPDGSIRLMSKQNNEFKQFLYETSWASYLSNELSIGEEIDGEMYIHGVEFSDIASLVMSYKRNQEELLEICEDTEEGLLINLKSKDILDLVYTGEFFPEPEYTTNANGSIKKTDRINSSMGAIEVGRNKGWIFPGFNTDQLQVIGTSDLEYWAFDVPEPEVVAEERNSNLANRWDNDYSHEHKITAVIAEEFNIDDIEEINASYVADGFEGTMIRLPSGYYAYGDRTAALLKYKLFHDAEWAIVDSVLDREGNPTLVFISDEGVEFRCRPTGNRAFRSTLIRDIDELKGELATIRYQTLFQDTLVPQFGRVVAIRNYE